MAENNINPNKLYDCIKSLQDSLNNIKGIVEDINATSKDLISESNSYGGVIAKVFKEQMANYFIPSVQTILKPIDNLINGDRVPGSLKDLTIFLDSVPLAMVRQEPSVSELTAPIVPKNTDIVTPANSNVSNEVDEIPTNASYANGGVNNAEPVQESLGDKEHAAEYLTRNYYRGNFDLETLNRKLEQVFGSKKIAGKWLADNDERIKHQTIFESKKPNATNFRENVEQMNESTNQFSKEDLNKLRNEIVLGSLFVKDYENSFGIDPKVCSNFFDGYLDEINNQMIENGVIKSGFEDKFWDELPKYDTPDNLYDYYSGLENPFGKIEESVKKNSITESVSVMDGLTIDRGQGLNASKAIYSYNGEPVATVDLEGKVIIEPNCPEEVINYFKSGRGEKNIKFKESNDNKVIKYQVVRSSKIGSGLGEDVANLEDQVVGEFNTKEEADNKAEELNNNTLPEEDDLIGTSYAVKEYEVVESNPEPYKDPKDIEKA